MNNPKKIRVALIYDRPDWVLGEIAMNITEQLNHRSTLLEINSYKTPRNYFELFNIESRNDLIHFLSPWDYYRYYHAVTKPRVVTIHHLVTFDQFKETIHRASAICTATLQWYKRLNHELSGKSQKIFVTPLIINTEIFKPIPGAREELLKQLKRPAKTILLGFAAKKSSDESGRKGLDRLFKLLEKLKKADFPFLLLIFGKGWHAEDFPQHLQQNIDLIGFIEAGQRPFYFGALDYYLCLSRVEGGPYPVAECMSSGVKVISTPVGIVPELISHETNGFIVEEDSYLETIPQILSEWTNETEKSRSLMSHARTTVVEKLSLGKSTRPEIFEPVYRYALKDFPTHLTLEKVTNRAGLMGRYLRKITQPSS